MAAMLTTVALQTATNVATVRILQLKEIIPSIIRNK